MKSIWVIPLLIGSVHAAEVTAILKGNELIPASVCYGATVQVSRMFAAIGVPLVWRKKPPAADSSFVIQIQFTTGTPAASHPDALAYTRPFARSHIITVLYDRLHTAVSGRPSLAPTLLAHVLAHEIGHVLLGTDMHTATGIMKAHWDTSDFRSMAGKPLPFTPLDQSMMRLRLHLANQESIGVSSSSTSSIGGTR